MGTITDKLQAILNSKNAIKNALTEITGEEVSDVMSTYADIIHNIEIVKRGTVLITLTTNDQSQEALLGVTITINYVLETSSFTQVLQWAGESIQLSFDENTEYTITVSDIDQYITPAVITNVISANTANNEILIYEVIPVTTILFDQTISDPTTMITRIVDKGGIEAIRANSHRYNGQLVDGIMQLTQLPDDGSGTPSSTVGIDVWMKLPQFYYNIETVDTWKYNVSFAYGKKPSEEWGEWDGKDMIGVYKASLRYNELYSISDVTPVGNMSYNSLHSISSFRNDSRFSMVKWKHHCVMAWLFYAWYSNTNCQAICGSGSSNPRKTTGGTNSLGMTDTTTENNNPYVNFWGLENWWGDIYEMVDNVTVYSDTCTWFIKENKSYNVFPSQTDGYIDKIDPKHVGFSDFLHVLPLGASGTSNTGLCDCYFRGTYSAGETYNILLRSCDNDHDYGGVAYVNGDCSPNHGHSSIGTRLCYRGDYIIVE